MDEELIFKMTGKTSEEIDEVIEQMRQRSKRTQEHQRMTREIFDVQWPSAVESGNNKDWSNVSIAINDVIEYIDKNSDYFPNYEGHILQWETLKKVADCVSCNNTKSCGNTCLDDSTIRQDAKVA
jgi:hypothetical protein